MIRSIIFDMVGVLMEEEDHYAYRNRSCCNPDSRV